MKFHQENVRGNKLHIELGHFTSIGYNWNLRRYNLCKNHLLRIEIQFLNLFQLYYMNYLI